MPVIVSMLRGVNLGPHHRLKMDALRALYESLGFTDVQTYVQSGNAIFRADSRDLPAVAAQIEGAIERKFGFRADTIVRTAAQLRKAVERNPFATRRNLEPNKFLVTFLAGDPDREGRKKLLQMKIDPEEVRVEGREVYIYYANGMAQPRLSWTQAAKMLKSAGTGRNWNTVEALLEMAEKLEAS